MIPIDVCLLVNECEVDRRRSWAYATYKPPDEMEVDLAKGVYWTQEELRAFGVQEGQLLMVAYDLAPSGELQRVIPPGGHVGRYPGGNLEVRGRDDR